MKTTILSRISLGTGIALLVSALAGFALVDAGVAAVQAALGAALLVFYFATNRGALGRTFSGRGSLFYGVTAVTTVALVAALVAVNYVAVRKKVSWDLTTGGIFTLAEDTVRTLQGLEEEVRVTAFYGAADPAWNEVSDLLARYGARTDKLAVEFVDPYAAPQLVQEKGIRDGGPRVIFSRGGVEARAAEITEESFTNALVRVLRREEKKLYAVTGHGERDVADLQGQRGYGRSAQTLADEGLEVKPLSLATGEVPDDAAAVLILGPERPFFEPEVEALRRYLGGGGSLFVALEPGFADPGLEGLLDEHGILFDQALVVDPVSRVMGGGTAIPVVHTYAEHEITRGFGLVSIFPTARPVVARGDADPRPTVLALSNPTAWGETDLNDPQARWDEGEKRGPLGLAVVAERNDMRIFAVGDVDFASNQFAAAGGNADLFLNAVNWLAAQEDRITIRPRHREASRLILTEADARFLNLFSINVLPMLVLAAGLSVWLVRRSR